MRKGSKLVHGVGINDADYAVSRYERINGKSVIVWKCPYYVKWKSMLGRCYYKRRHEKYPTYIGCTVCDEWLYFSNFKRWALTQNCEGRQLDKDFIIEDNKIYSPSTCVFIPSNLNTFIITCGRSRGDYPIGVSYQKKPAKMINERTKPYMALVHNQTGKRVYLGRYSTPEEAHQAYLRAKLEQCVSYIEEFKSETLIIKGLERIKAKIQYHIDNSLELTSF